MGPVISHNGGDALFQMIDSAEQLEDQGRPSHRAVPAIRCQEWCPSSAVGSDCPADGAQTAAQPLTVVCVKWGKRYDAAYVNRLFAGVCKHFPGPAPPFVCFTDDATGLDPRGEVRALPGGLPLWWGKAYLFSEEARLDGRRVLFLDLDQVIVGSLAALAQYSGPFALLRTDGIACELAAGGYNSSVMAWEASPFFRPVFGQLMPAARKYVHRFDHWLEMMVDGAGLWQDLAPGSIIDYTASFRGGVCIGSAEEPSIGGCFAVQDEATVDNSTAAGAPRPEEQEPPEGTALVTFPRSPKPHEVLEQHPWVRRHWLGDDDGSAL